MKIIKKDFVNEDTESYCAKGHKLSSGTAYYMESKDGKIYFGGKQCAETHGTNDLKDVPDLTKSLVSLGTGTQTSGGNGSGVTEEKKKSLAISYLLLREELLNEFTLNKKPLSYKVLNKYYNHYTEHNSLNENQINHILNLEKYASENIDIKLSIRNLSTCHAYKFILDRTEAHLSENENGIRFVQSLRKYLLSHCTLQPNQVIGLSNWIQYLPKGLRDAKLKNFD
nr:hypothetical protein [Pseudomonas sp.]